MNQKQYDKIRNAILKEYPISSADIDSMLNDIFSMSMLLGSCYAGLKHISGHLEDHDSIIICREMLNAIAKSPAAEQVKKITKIHDNLVSHYTITGEFGKN